MPRSYTQLQYIINYQREQRAKRLRTDPAFRERVAFARNRADLRKEWNKTKDDAGFKLIMNRQTTWKKAMRYAIRLEIKAFKRKKILSALASGQVELARLYQLPKNHADAYQVGHKKSFVELLALFLLEKKLCWEDLKLGFDKLLLDPEQVDSWQAWHQSYSEMYDNLFLLTKVQNNKASKRWAMMPSRQFGSF